jgi:hypothetical protein
LIVCFLTLLFHGGRKWMEELPLDIVSARERAKGNGSTWVNKLIRNYK